MTVIGRAIKGQKRRRDFVPFAASTGSLLGSSGINELRTDGRLEPVPGRMTEMRTRSDTLLYDEVVDTPAVFSSSIVSMARLYLNDLANVFQDLF